MEWAVSMQNKKGNWVLFWSSVLLIEYMKYYMIPTSPAMTCFRRTTPPPQQPP